jgi:hypothetical protein
MKQKLALVLQDGNPFLRGEKLPVAAKKGIDVVY